MPKLLSLSLTTFLLVLLALLSFSHAQTYTVLYNLGVKSSDPINPSNSGTIVQGRDGNLYTTIPQGASTGEGAAVKITPAGVLTVLHVFGSSSTDGINPTGGLTLGTDGNYYGTTSGGCCQLGTIFKMSSAGSLTTLYSFSDQADGLNPETAPIQANDGNYYGTVAGGNQGLGFYGSIYKITSSGTFTVLHSLVFGDGAFPWAPLMQATNGSFYGTTEAGATNNEGNAFKITSGGTFASLFTFDGPHGQNPFSPLIQGTDGNFYGTTANGGANGHGEVFKMTSSGAITVLHSFTASGDGAYVAAGLVQATDGNLYGTTKMADGSTGCGTIFRVGPTGANFSTLFTFPTDGSMGCNPEVTLIQHTNGILYGLTNTGGTGNSNHGVFFSLNANLNPFVALLSYSGKEGKVIEFLGQGFNSSTTVSFNGTPATPTISSSTYLTAAVPSGATSGFVTVTTSAGSLKSKKKFMVTPQIISFSPTSGPVGTQVVITGVSLIQTTKVTFGGVAATAFTVNSDTQVTATVPTGAKSGKIAITTPGGTATSSTSFTVT